MLERCLNNQVAFQGVFNPKLWLSGRQMGCCHLFLQKAVLSHDEGRDLGSFHLLLSDPFRTALLIFVKNPFSSPKFNRVGTLLLTDCYLIENLDISSSFQASFFTSGLYP